MKRWRRSAVAMASLVGLLNVGTSVVSAQTLPPQAPPVAHEHTHGPDGLDLDARGRPAPAAPPYDVDRHADWSSNQHDGQPYTSDLGDGDRVGLAMFHAVYVYPSDKPEYAQGTGSRFSTFAAMFQADARQASQLLSDLYGRAIRFDERDGGLLDITVFRSKYNSRQLAGSRQFNLVNDELAAAKNPDGTLKFAAPNKKYMAWLDAGSRYCGQANLSHDARRVADNQNEGRTLAIVYRPYDMSDSRTGGFCRGRTLRHELGHALGALQKDAPSSFDDAHCNDSAEDTMCYTSETTHDPGDADFDYRNDDYWDPVANPSYAEKYPSGPGGKLGWWTVNLSKYLCDAPTSCHLAASTPPYK